MYECCSSFRKAGRPAPAHVRPAVLVAGGPGVRGAARGRRDGGLYEDRRLPGPADRHGNWYLAHGHPAPACRSPGPGGRTVRRLRRAGRGVARQAFHRRYRTGAQADRIGPDLAEPGPPGAVQPEVRTATPRTGVAGDVPRQADRRHRPDHARPVRRRPRGDRGGTVRGLRRGPRHGRDGRAGPALRRDLHGQQGPASLGDRRAGRLPGPGGGPARQEGHRQARLQRCVRRGLRRGVRDVHRQRQGLLPPRHALHAGPGAGVHRHDPRRGPADRPDPRPGLPGEPLLAHPQPRPQEGLREVELGVGPDPARQVRDPLPAVLVVGHHPARLGAGGPEDPALPARGLAHLGLPRQGARPDRRLRGDGGAGGGREGREGAQGGAGRGRRRTGAGEAPQGVTRPAAAPR
ncbi:hypothetical protein SGPA1_11121 [Streptomyces misionensis JCM 4497]